MAAAEAPAFLQLDEVSVCCELLTSGGRVLPPNSRDPESVEEHTSLLNGGCSEKAYGAQWPALAALADQ